MKKKKSNCLFFLPSPLGVLCPGGGGDDGGEPPGRAAADSAFHHEQVALGGDVPRPALPSVHRRDHGTCKNTKEVFISPECPGSSPLNTNLHVCRFTSVASSSPSLVQGEYVSCLLSLLQQMTEIHFHHLLNNFHSKEELKVRSSCATPADALVRRRLDSHSCFVARSSCSRSSAFSGTS